MPLILPPRPQKPNPAPSPANGSQGYTALNSNGASSSSQYPSQPTQNQSTSTQSSTTPRDSIVSLYPNAGVNFNNSNLYPPTQNHSQTHSPGTVAARVGLSSGLQYRTAHSRNGSASLQTAAPQLNKADSSSSAIHDTRTAQSYATSSSVFPNYTYARPSINNTSQTPSAGVNTHPPQDNPGRPNVQSQGWANHSNATSTSQYQPSQSCNHQILASPAQPSPPPKRKLVDSDRPSPAKKARTGSATTVAPLMPSGVGFTRNINYSSVYGQKQIPAQASFNIVNVRNSQPPINHNLPKPSWTHPPNNRTIHAQEELNKRAAPVITPGTVHSQDTTPHPIRRHVPKSGYLPPAYHDPPQIFDNDLNITYGSSSYIDPKLVRAASATTSPPQIFQPKPPPRSRKTPAPSKKKGKAKTGSPPPLPKLTPEKPKQKARSNIPPEKAPNNPTKAGQQAPTQSKSVSFASVDSQQSRPIQLVRPNQPSKPTITTATLPQDYRGGAIPNPPAGCLTARGYDGSQGGDKTIAAPEFVPWTVPPPGYEPTFSKLCGAKASTVAYNEIKPGDYFNPVEVFERDESWFSVLMEEGSVRGRACVAGM